MSSRIQLNHINIIKLDTCRLQQCDYNPLLIVTINMKIQHHTIPLSKCNYFVGISGAVYGQHLSCVGRNGCDIYYKKRRKKYKYALFSQIYIQLKFFLAHKHFSNMVHR